MKEWNLCCVLCMYRAFYATAAIHNAGHSSFLISLISKLSSFLLSLSHALARHISDYRVFVRVQIVPSMTSLKKSCSNIPSSFLLPLFLDIVVLVSCWDQGCLETYKVKSSGAYLIARGIRLTGRITRTSVSSWNWDLCYECGSRRLSLVCV